MRAGDSNLRSLWKGSISFGLVNIPVKLYPATENKDVKFHLIHRECGSPIRYSRVCPICNREVEPQEISRGYEYQKERYVLVSDEEWEQAQPAPTGNIDLIQFVALNQIDPIYFSWPYYLTPNEGGQKGYALLLHVMRRTGKIALAKVALRNRESLAALRVYQSCLLMESLLYADEIRPIDLLPELNFEVQLDDREIKMAETLVAALSGDFKPEEYHDTYRENLLNLIRQKIAGQEISMPPPARQAKVVDLMEALKASIEEAEKRKQKPKRQRRKREA